MWATGSSAGQVTRPRACRRAEIRRLPPRARIALALALVALAAGVGLSWWLWSGRDTSRHIPSERAQELYLDGLQLRSRRDIDTTNESIAKFAAALQEDPNYSEAWAAYGTAISIAVIRQKLTPAEGIPKARAAAARAIELAPGEALGYVLLGQILMDHDKDFAGAKRELDRAMQLDDHESLVWHHLAMWHGQLGHVEEAFAAIRRARELEPTRPIYTANYSLLLYETRRYDEAIGMAKQVIERNARFDQARSVLARALMATGDLAGALEQAQANGDSGPNQGDLGMVYAKLGRRETRYAKSSGSTNARAVVSPWRMSRRRSTPRWATSRKACAALTRAVTDHSLLVNWMRLEPRLDPLRGSQCYADAERKLYGDEVGALLLHPRQPPPNALPLRRLREDETHRQADEQDGAADRVDRMHDAVFPPVARRGTRRGTPRARRSVSRQSTYRFA